MRICLVHKTTTNHETEVCVPVIVNWQSDTLWQLLWLMILLKWLLIRSINHWAILKSLIWEEELTWELKLYKESPVLAILSVHGVHAKLSILKSGQDRLALQASLSHCESVKCLDNRGIDTADWQPGRKTERQINRNMKKSHGKPDNKDRRAGSAQRQMMTIFGLESNSVSRWRF